MANMKRGGEFDPAMDGPKRSRGQEDRFDMRVLVPSKMAGSVIGKGGQNIQRLRSEWNAQVRIPDCPGPERVMAIQAGDVESVVGILQTAIPFMYEQGEEDDGAERDLRLLIHQSIVGGIIGKSGQKIKDIRENTGANIKSSDRCVQVTGSLDKLVSALHLIFEVVANTDIKGYDNHYDPINFDAFYANEYGGYGGDGTFGGGRGGGRGGMRGGPPHRGRGNFGPPRGRGNFPGGPFGNRGGFGGPGYGPGPDMEAGFGFGRGGGRGRGGFVRGGRGGGFSEGFGEETFGGFHGGGRGGGGGPGFGRGGGGAGGFPSGFGGSHDGGFPFDNTESLGSDGEAESTQVTIPNDLAGAIIGPGGQRIRKIRNDSKATITIDEPAPGSTERVITIAGNKKQIQTAQYLLQQSVRENSGVGGGGGY